MDRLIAAANFVHSNMPNGTTWQSPVLQIGRMGCGRVCPVEPRPHKSHLEQDYPVALQKPVDNGYGPYADGFNQQQHRLGPFEPIRERIKQLLAQPASE